MEPEQLRTLLGAYYHEDFEGIWSTLDQFLADASIVEVVELSREIRDFLDRTPPPEVPQRLTDIGSYLWLGDSPALYVEWLDEVRRRVLAHVRRSQVGVLMGEYYGRHSVETLWETLDLYLSDSTTSDIRALTSEITTVLSGFTEYDLETLLVSELGGDVVIREEPGGFRGWLDEVARRAAAHL